MNSRLEAQNDVIIALLARSTIGLEAIYKAVTTGKKKGKPSAFIQAYNALDGTKTIGDVAAIVGITQQGMGSVLQTWEDDGIVYKVGSGTLARYFGLLKLPRSTYKGDQYKVAAKLKGKGRKTSRKTAQLEAPGGMGFEPGEEDKFVGAELADAPVEELVDEAPDTLEGDNGNEGEEATD